MVVLCEQRKWGGGEGQTISKETANGLLDAGRGEEQSTRAIIQELRKTLLIIVAIIVGVAGRGVVASSG